MSPPPASAAGSARDAWVLAALLAVAAGQGLWNAFHAPPLTGYDAGGHAAYALTILREGRLPHPTEGWSTFHPPLYALLASGLWALFDGASGRVLTAALRLPSLLGWLALGFASFRALRHLGVSLPVSSVATALVLFVPASQMSAAMIGNEALGAGVAAVALLFVLRLASDPGQPRAALGAGLFAGLALATKATGIWTALAAALPFLRRRLGAPGRRAAAVCALALLLVAGPVYLRNVWLTGSPLPNILTREVGPQKRAEEAFQLGPRRLRDYLWLDPACILHPSVYVIPGPDGKPWDLNPHMSSVFGLLYATTWWDAYGFRISPRLYGNSGHAPLLAILGLVPSLLVVVGFALSLGRVLRRRPTPEWPLVGMTLAALATYVAFTLGASSLVTAKGAYLLPLGLPAAVFFARAAEALPRRLRSVALTVSLAAAAAAALYFTEGLVFETTPIRPTRDTWLFQARQLPGTHIDEAVHALIDRY